MIKKKCLLIVITLLFLLAGCSNEEENKTHSFQKMKGEVNEEFQLAKDGKYDNLNILCDEVLLPQTDELKVMRFPVYTFTKEMTLKEKIEFYQNVVFPKVLDVDSVEAEYIVDKWSYDFDTKTFSRDYAYMIEHLDELEDSALVGYDSNEDYNSVETIPEGVCFNLALGAMGKLMKDNDPFIALYYEKVKTYDCDRDDLSDSYLLMDGTKKTVADAKLEIETYLNAHYPIVGEDNGIRNEVYEITVRKIPDTEYHIFDAERTFSFEGICTREYTMNRLENENVVMGQAFLCESDKVDLLLGFVNCFDKGTVSKVYEEYIPFEEVMARLSYYMTDETVFDVEHIGMEYRMFTETVDNKTYYNWIPYWLFRVKNPNDDSLISVYINVETGEIESAQS